MSTFLLGDSVEETTNNYIRLRNSLRHSSLQSELTSSPRLQDEPKSDPTERIEGPSLSTATRKPVETEAEERLAQRSAGPRPRSSSPGPNRLASGFMELEDDRLIRAAMKGVPLDIVSTVDGAPRIAPAYLADPLDRNPGGSRQDQSRKKNRSRAGSRTNHTRSRSRSLSQSLRLDNPIYEGSHRLFTPGPGSYSVRDRDRHGGGLLKGTSVGFAMSGRILSKVLLEKNESPGPCYMPKDSKLLASRKNDAQTVFGRFGAGSRFSATFGEPTNGPMWNPGPGTYKPHTNRKGSDLLSSGVKIGTSEQHRTAGGFMTTPTPLYYSKDHERENLGAHSPGPAAYNPETASKKVKPSGQSYSLRPRGISVWDELTHPRMTYTPGPNYTPTTTRKGQATLGDAPRCRFGRSLQRDRPEERLSRSAFISEEHARVSNTLLHAPPSNLYSPKPVQKNIASPVIGSGAPRMYNRFELGRI